MKLDYFLDGAGMIPEIIIGTTVVYLIIIWYTKLFGLKSFSKMTSFDFAHTIAVGSLMAATIGTGSPSILLGAILLLALYSINYAISYAQKKSDRLEKLIENQPILLMRRGKVLHENLNSTIVTESELQAKLREANVTQLSQVQAVVLETTGDVSVLHGDEEVEDYILNGVRQEAD